MCAAHAGRGFRLEKHGRAAMAQWNGNAWGPRYLQRDMLPTETRFKYNKADFAGSADIALSRRNKTRSNRQGAV